MPRKRGVLLQQITMSPPADIVDRLRETAEKLDVPMVKIVEVALRRFFEAEEKRRKKGIAG